MITALAKQLAARMRAKNLTVSQLERKANINSHGALNILRGNSKRPSAEILHAIATVLGCDISDLLSDHGLFQVTESEKSRAELLNGPYEKPHLYQETLAAVNAKINREKRSFTLQQALTCVEEVYFHALQKNRNTFDPDFLDWFVEKLG